MKVSANLTAIDDVARAVGKSADDILGSVDDLTKVIDGVDDSAKAASKFLKFKGITNVDDVLNSVDNATDAVKIMDAAKTQGKLSSLDALKAKDLKGTKKLTETAKADLDDYGTKRTSKKTAKSNYDAVKNAYDESLKNNGWCEETYEAADNLRVAQDKMNAADDALSGTKIQQSKNAKAKVKKDISDVQDSLNEANKALKAETKTVKKAGKKQD